MSAQTLHFANLTRGVLCPHLRRRELHYCRIQSTSCEQKLWADVIHGAGPDLLMAMALGRRIVVHDVSERPRETRAMWQGLTFVRRAAETVWGLEASPVEGRGGVAMTAYFDHQIRNLDTPARRVLRHYRQHLATDRLDVQSCWEIPMAVSPARWSRARELVNA